MIPKYLSTPTSSFTAPLPISTSVVLKEESQGTSQKRLEKIVSGVTKSFQFADNAGNHYYSGNR